MYRKIVAMLTIQQKNAPLCSSIQEGPKKQPQNHLKIPKLSSNATNGHLQENPKNWKNTN